MGFQFSSYPMKINEDIFMLDTWEGGWDREAGIVDLRVGHLGGELG